MSELERASREELLHYLEEISGRTIRTREDVERYVQQVSSAKPEASARRWQTAKSVILLVLACAAALQYYLLDIMLQIASMPRVTFFVG